MSDEIVQRWRKPALPLAVEDQYTHTTIINGREVLEVKTRWKPEDIERFRLGYVCMNCIEPHEQPFPEKCSLCNYPMRDKQPAEFERAFKGVERDPRAKRIEEGLDRVDETHERNFYVVKNGIVIPRNLRRNT